MTKIHQASANSFQQDLINLRQCIEHLKQGLMTNQDSLKPPLPKCIQDASHPAIASAPPLDNTIEAGRAQAFLQS